MNNLYQASQSSSLVVDDLQDAPSDFIGAVDGLLNMCSRDNSHLPGDYVVQVKKVRGEIQRILVMNGLEAS